VSFTPPFSLTNKYYRAIKAICFDGATMDKLTYAALKGGEIVKFYFRSGDGVNEKRERNK
jgi:hypothetical protein